jgi:hypothetical protein
VLKHVFAHFSLFYHELGLYGKEMIAIDGSKFRANNARKKNLTKGKVTKMLAHFEQSAEQYLELLEHSEDTDETIAVTCSKEDLQLKLAKATQRINELSQLKDQIEAQGEISLTDPEADLWVRITWALMWHTTCK